MMDAVEIISAVLGLSCVVLAGRNSTKNFWVGYAYNIFLFVLFWKQKLFAAMALQVVSFAINVYGHYRWTHPEENERSASDSARLKVSGISCRQWVLVLLAVAAGTFILGWMLSSRSEDPSPWLDACIFMFTLLAQFLSAQKRWECWVVWLAVNAANIALYISAGLTWMPVVSGLYLANGVWSLITWLRLYKNNE